jgi:hypothetical protein
MLLVRWAVLFLLLVSALLFAAFIATGETRYRVWGWKVLRVLGTLLKLPGFDADTALGLATRAAGRPADKTLTPHQKSVAATLCSVRNEEHIMFEPVSIPFGAKMLINTIKLKPGVNFDDVELALGEMCNVLRAEWGTYREPI